MENQELNLQNEAAFQRKHSKKHHRHHRNLPRANQVVQTEAESSVTLRNLQGDVIGTFSLGDLQAHRYGK